MTPQRSQKSFTLILLFGICVAGAAVLITCDPFSIFMSPAAGDDPLSSDDGEIILLDRTGSAWSLAGDDLLHDGFGPGVEDLEDPLPEKLIAAFLTASVKGRVEDRAGEPLGEARIEIASSLPESLRGILPGGRHRAGTETDAEGCFAIALPEEGAFRMTVARAGFAPHTVNPVLPGDDLTIVLEAGALLAGVLTDGDTGNAVGGALVRARHHFQVFEETSDDAGSYSLRDLPDGVFSVDVIHDGHELARVDGVRVARESENRLDVELNPAGPLEGRVLALDGHRPISGAQVVYRMSVRRDGGREDAVRLETATDAKGEFSFESASRRGYRLEVFAEGFSPGVPEPSGPGRGRNGMLEIYLKRGSAASGTVFGPDGSVVEGAVVAIAGQRLPGGPAPEAATDERGRFTIRGLEGGVPFTLFARHDDHGPGDSGELLVPEGELRRDVEIRLQLASSIAGTVYGIDGEPFPGARVTLDGIKGYVVRYGGAVPMALADGDGRYFFDRLVEGTYRLAASKGKLRSGLEEIVLAGGAAQEMELHLADGLSLVGQVTDYAGEPLDDVLVTAVDWDPGGPGSRASRAKLPKTGNQAKSTKSKTSGKAPKTPRASKASNTTKASNATKAPKARKTAPKKPSAPSPADRLEERVKRFISSRPESATPGEFEMMRRLGYARFRGNARTDRDGWFTLTGLKAEDVLLLSFRRFGYEPVVLADVAPGAGKVAAVLSPQVSLAGCVVDFATSLPVRSFRVEWALLPPGIPATADLSVMPNLFRGASRSFRNDDGTFLIDDIAAGDVALRVTAKGYRAGKPHRLFISDRYPAPLQRISLERGGSIQGRVVAGNGSPVPSIPVFLKKAVKERPESKRKKSAKKTKKTGKSTKTKSTAPRAASRRTDAAGRALFTDLDAGSYELVVGSLSAPVARPVPIRLGRGKNTSKTVILRDLGKVEVRVKRKMGLSSRAQAELSGGPGKVTLRKETGNLGLVTFDNLLAGSYRLKISARGYKTWQRTLSLEKKGKIEEEVELEEKD